MFINIIVIVLYGTNITINVAITINGPNAMYWSIFLIFVARKMILKIAPIKKDNNVIMIIFVNPKYSPNAPISLTSPSPIASLPYISPPKRVSAKNIPAPANIPNTIFIDIATSDNPYRKAKTKPTSKIVRFSLLGII